VAHAPACSVDTREFAGVGDGEEDGTFEPVLDGVAAAGFAPGETGATGDAAYGVREGWGDVEYVIEGEDPVLAGEVEELGSGSRHGGEGAGTGIDESTEDEGGEGFAAA
jgi:hypothetical protein